METDNLYINNALDWLKRAVDSLVSHKRTDEGTGFIRSSKQIIPEQKEGIFYTATFKPTPPCWKVRRLMRRSIRAKRNDP